MKKNKVVIKSDIEFGVETEVKDAISVKIKEIVDEMSIKYMRNIEVKVDLEIH